MAMQVTKPYVTVVDSNGNPYVAAKLYVYLIGTTTLASIYSNEGLSVAASNPATSDAAGNFPRLYIAAGTYKLRAETSAGVLIWQEDNIDTGLPGATGALPISRGGTGGTTAAAARAALDVPSNSELAAISTTVTEIQTTVQGITPVPGGRLTMTSAAPVIVSDVTAGTALYYTPYTSTICPIYDGAQFNATTFAELTLTLHANHLANLIYDIFVINDSGTVRLVTGPAWNTSTAAAGARGTGAGTTELERKNGIWTNKVAMTARNGATTYSVNAFCGTYVGSMLMDGTNGQLTCHVTYGQSRKFGLWNAYNRKPILLQMGDATASWTYNTATVRQSRATAGNTLAVFAGLPEEAFDIDFQQSITFTTNNGASGTIGVGVNSTTVMSGRTGSVLNPAASTAKFDTRARHIVQPTIGLNNINSLETANTTTVTQFNGANAEMLMTARWLG